jgi:tight adherence protein C
VSTALGGWVGLLLGVGVLLVAARLPVRRRAQLADRVLPYLRDLPGFTSPAGPPRSAQAPAGWSAPAVRTALAGRLDRLLGGAASVRRRLDRTGGGTVEDFRARQVVWASTAVAIVLGLGVIRLAAGQAPAPGSLAVLAGAAAAAGVWGCDRQLSRQAASARASLVLQLPAAAELVALAVAAGEGPTAALSRVARTCHGELGRDLARVLADVRAGTAVPVAMDAYALRCDVPSVRRFVDAFVVALERGTPLAAVLRAQAVDAREAARNELVALAARREVLMLLPVVFVVLPVTVVFALFPGFWGLRLQA